MEKKVSVIVPVYNVQDYLKECLDALVAQTYTNLEILCVNDGSTDDSVHILDEYANQDTRIVVLDKANGGLSDARNVGLDHATGDYIACVDSDDLVTPDMVEQLVHRIEETDSDIAVCDMEYFYDDGTISASDGGSFDISCVVENPHLIAINNSACNKLVKKELYEDVRFPKGKYYEDLATVPILLYKAKRVCKVNAPLYRYRQRAGSIAHSANPNIFHIYDAIEGMINYVKEHGNEPLVITELQHLYVLHGLDLTTLRIKDFSNKEIRREYLAENMSHLERLYPNYKQDTYYQSVGGKKKMIFTLLGWHKYDWVLRIYDR